MISPNIRQYWGYYRNKKKALLFSIFLAGLQTVALLPIALIVQHISEKTLPQKNSQELLVLLALMCGLFIINALAILWNRHVTLTLVKAIIHNLRKNILEKSLYFDRTFFLREDLDIVHATIVQDSERVESMTNALLTQLLPGFCISIGLSCVLIYLNPFLFIIVALIFIILFAFGRITRSKIRKSMDLFHHHFALFSKKVLFALKFNELIKLSTAEKIELQEQENTLKNLRDSGYTMAWLITAHTVMQNNMLMLSGTAVLLLGGMQVIHGTTTLGALLSFYIALGLLSNNLKGVVSTLPTIIEGFASLDDLVSLTQKDILLNQQETQPLQPFSGLRKQIAFDQISFAHSSTFNLSNITFTIPQGKTTGIFGASGSGKSTLIALLLGFFRPDSGSITIDDKNIHAIDLISYRQRVGVLSQDPLIFPGTIRENLTYGLTDVSLEEIVKACTVAEIDSFISGLSAGYNSIIGERGVTISGGQKQRLAIARALLRKPELLILDEPDNNLDDATSIAIIQKLKALGLTLVIISHNQAIIPQLDQLFQFDPQTKKLIAHHHASKN